jgi:DNA (cytosine-5)-methyltransferase 1
VVMTMIKYGSVCSGVEAATVAWHSLGWQPQWFSEIEKFPSAVLKHHYPAVPNHGDMTKFKEWNDGRPIDVLVGGTPCQSFSVAGLRKGLDDPRGNLMLTYLAIAERYAPKWIVWENVPGVLSSNRGRDFGTFLGALGQLGYGFAYRVLDAQYFGVAQRRKRVFVVGYLGDWRRAAAVLFERHSLQGNIAPRREKGEKVAPTVTTGAPFSRTGNESVECEAIVPSGYTSSSFGGYHQGVGTIRAAGGDLGGGSETLCVSQPIAFSSKQQSMKTSDNVANTLGANDYKEPQAVAIQNATRGASQNGLGITTDGPMYTLDVGSQHAVAIGWSNELDTLKDLQPTIQRGGAGGRHDGVMVPPSAVAYDTTNITSPTNGSNPKPGDPVFTLASGQHPPLLTPHVRRLTPIECERLQGFPDNYTDIKPKGKPTPDGPRYKSMGNSMAVPVMNWIGRRIQMVEDTE